MLARASGVVAPIQVPEVSASATNGDGRYVGLNPVETGTKLE